MQVNVTHHAVEQYVNRHRRDMDENAARSELEAACLGMSVTYERGKPYKGKVWRLAILGVDVIAVDEGPVRTVTTCLPAPAYLPHDEGEYEEVLSVVERSTEEATRVRDDSLATLQSAHTARLDHLANHPDVKGKMTNPVEVSRRKAMKNVVAQRSLAHDSAVIELAILREELKTVRHALTARETDRKVKSALRCAMQALHGATTKESALAMIEDINPGFLESAFWLRDAEPEVTP